MLSSGGKLYSNISTPGNKLLREDAMTKGTDGYFRATSPPFLQSSPTQNAAFLLLVASEEANSFKTNGISAYNVQSKYLMNTDTRY